MTTNAPGAAAQARPKLRCMRGQEGPAELLRDIEIVAALPASARRSLWEALGPSLSEPLPAPVEGLLDEFCRRHNAPGPDVARALKACRFLMREASKIDLPKEALADDLAAIGATEEVRAILLAGYERARAFVRTEILRGALVGHGKLLTRADYRIDNVVAAADGAKIHAPIALITLAYQEGERREQITLQATPDAIRELKRICEEIIG